MICVVPARFALFSRHCFGQPLFAVNICLVGSRAREPERQRSRVRSWSSCPLSLPSLARFARWTKTLASRGGRTPNLSMHSSWPGAVER